MSAWVPSDDAAKMGVKRLTAFAEDLFQPFDIQDSNFAVMIFDKPGLLDPLGDMRDAISIMPSMCASRLLGKRQEVAVEQIAPCTHDAEKRWRTLAYSRQSYAHHCRQYRYVPMRAVARIR